MADAVEAAPEKAVIHRDFKGANVKVKPDGTVKVLDFGLAKALESGPADPIGSNSPTLSLAANQQGVILGTAAYMSPEQARGATVDKRCDIWSFGVVFFEMLTGKQLFAAETISDTLASVLRADIDWNALPGDTPASIRALLRRCLSRDLKLRLRDIGEGRIVIDECLANPAGAAAPETQPEVARALRGRFAWGVALVLGVALAVMATIHFRETPPRLQTARFEVSPPENSAVTTFQLSPDGRYLAFAVTGAGNKSQLWVRPIDSLEARALPGTENASFPFWSPDSAYLGFAADGKLKKVAVTGGPAQTLSDANDFRGGTWNSNGIIVFSADLNLYRVAAGGGTRSPVAKHTGGEIYRFPQFLPDGQSLLYLFTGVGPEAAGIYAGSLAERPPIRLLPDLSGALHLPPNTPGQSGYLLFRRENTLMAQSFDPSGFRLTGDVFPVAEQVGGTFNYPAVSVSANGTLAFARGSAGNRQLVWMDRSGKRLGVIGKPGDIAFESLSPDEKKIVFALGDVSNDQNIWLHDLARGTTTRFTFGAGNFSCVWSPDGSRIAYQSSPTTGPNSPSDIYQKPASGAGKEELLLRVGRNMRVQDWSRDGKFLVYIPDATSADLWLLPLEGERRPLPYLATQFRETNGQLSPDGKWMAYRSNESGRDQVYVQPVPATGAKFQISTEGGSRPRWRRDGKELFYASADGKLMAVPIQLGASVEAGVAQPLFDFMPPDANPHQFFYQPTADGQRFLVNAPAESATAAPITVVLNWTAGLKK